jgi:hypothetical protein
VQLENIDQRIISMAFETAFEKSSKQVSSKVLQNAASATKGYPYLFQLIGFYLWKSDNSEIDETAVARVLEISKVELFQNIHDIIFRELSEVDKQFLFAMAQDTEESSFGAIRERMNADKGYASKYRQRLLDAGVVQSSAYGKLVLTPPYMREYLLIKLEELN